MKNNKTKIAFEYNGTKYTLEFTADSLKQMERSGFKFGKMDETILTAPLDLFCGAFIANHKNVPRKMREEIYDALCDSEEGGQTIADAIGYMLSEAIEELTSHQGNVKWSILK